MRKNTRMTTPTKSPRMPKTSEPKPVAPDAGDIWSEKVEIKLFKEWGAAVYLYDGQHSKNKDNDAKDRKIRAIAKELKLPENVVRQHMQNSRSSFSRAKRVHTDKGYESLTPRQKFIWQHLGFLYPFVKPAILASAQRLAAHSGKTVQMLVRVPTRRKMQEMNKTMTMTRNLGRARRNGQKRRKKKTLTSQGLLPKLVTLIRKLMWAHRDPPTPTTKYPIREMHHLRR